MSSRKGGKAKGPPCHQNKVAWVPNRSTKKNETEPGSKLRPLSAITGVCPRCREQIEWRRKYGKYKMLKEPAKCASCTRRTVKDAYHAICRDCASQQNVCGKCRRPAEAIIPDLSAEEEAEKAKLEEALKNMRERDRRTLLRELAKPGAARDELIANAKLKQADSDEDSDDDSLGLSEDEDAGGSQDGQSSEGDCGSADSDQEH